ncbi:hypothetical protein FD754_020752, partial [Muntiacus muntjak]
EPVLFTGTIRKNLDPFNEHIDDELWNALEEVQLKESMKVLHAKMNSELAESGLNLSVGQKQLVYLARAILRKNLILIIDKATSYVDSSSYKKMFVRDLPGALCITHRLNTIIDFLDSGKRKEHNQPNNLLQDRNSLFYKMVQQLGEAEAAVLSKMAK